MFGYWNALNGNTEDKYGRPRYCKAWLLKLAAEKAARSADDGSKRLDLDWEDIRDKTKTNKSTPAKLLTKTEFLEKYGLRFKGAYYKFEQNGRYRSMKIDGKKVVPGELVWEWAGESSKKDEFVWSGLKLVKKSSLAPKAPPALPVARERLTTEVTTESPLCGVEVAEPVPFRRSPVANAPRTPRRIICVRVPDAPRKAENLALLAKYRRSASRSDNSRNWRKR